MSHLTDWVSQYGYLAVFVLMFAESACIPIPSEVIMMFGGALAAGAISSTGSPPLLIGIVIAGILGNVGGSYLSWAVGKYAGQAAISRWGRRIGIRDAEIAKATSWFERHGPVAVLVGRVVPVIRTFISLPAGFAEMPAGLFGLYTTLGCIPWTAALGIAGYVLGSNWQSVANDFHGPTYAIAALIALGLVIVFVRHRRRSRAAEAPKTHETYEPREAYEPRNAYEPREAYEQGVAYEPRNAYEPREAYEPRNAYEQGVAYDPREAYEPGRALEAANAGMPPANQAPLAYQPDPYNRQYR